jgi:hypothetical protein
VIDDGPWHIGCSLRLRGHRRSEEEETTMIPATFPGFPVTVFPGLLAAPLSMALGGVSVVDVTAAVAVLAWGLGGLIALRIAIRMSRDDRPPRSTDSAAPTDKPGFRNAAKASDRT